MATIKSYTSLEQSEKLSEILPLESADMHYVKAGGIWKIWMDNLGKWEQLYKEKGFNYLPCWSLSALLNILPDIHLKKYIYNGNAKYYVTLVGINQYNTNHYNNPVDACYELILKLNELKML